MKKCIALALIIAFILPLSLQVSVSAAALNYNNVINDMTFDNVNTMTSSKIDAFLNTFPNSCISTSNGFAAPDVLGYNPTDSFVYGNDVSAGTIIYHAAQAYGINPRVLLTDLQKEQGLVKGDGPNIVRPTDDSTDCGALAISASMGYNCPDSLVLTDYSGFEIYSHNGEKIISVKQTCVESASYVGFSRQVINAAWKLTFDRHRSEGQQHWHIDKPNWDNSDDLEFCYNGPMTEGTFAVCPSGSAAYYDGYTTLDGEAIHMDNGATAALYHYTPHKHGQELFFDIFTNWFGPTTLKDTYNFEKLAGASGAINNVSSSSLGDATKTLVIGNEIYVFYYDATNQDLRLARWNGQEWVDKVIDGKGGTRGRINADVGQNITAMPFNGTIQLYYYDKTNGALRHARYENGQWGFETLDGTNSSFTGNTADVGQNPTVMQWQDIGIQLYYYDATHGSLKHAWWNGSKWRFETMIGSNGSLQHTTHKLGQYSAVMTWQGVGIQMYFYDQTAGSLKHAWWNGSKWRFETMDGVKGSLGGDSSSNTGLYTTMTEWGTDGIQMYYYDKANGSLRHAWWNGSKWRFETMDGTSSSVFGNDADIGTQPVIAKYDGDLFLFYYNTTDSAWRVAYYTHDNWYPYILDGTENSIHSVEGAVGGQLSLGVYHDTSLQVFYQGKGQTLEHMWINR